MSRRVLIAGGGTGGHIFPGLAVAGELTRRSIEVHWLGARRGLEKDLVTGKKIPLTMVEIEGMNSRNISAAVRALGQLPKAVGTAANLILQLQPEALLGVGGYASAAGVVAAGLLGLPWMLQEQNSVPGLTNRFLAPWADLVCCGFSEAIAHFPSQPAVWTGNPVRDQFFKVGDISQSDSPRLLILGGSQGSLFLNRTLPRAIAALRDRGSEVQVRHQAGKRWIEVVKTAYADLGVEARVEAFISEPWEALGEADLVVARSGALTVSELAAAGRCGLLIPFAAAAGNHQEFNARALERASGAVVLTEAQAEASRVAETLYDLLGNQDRLIEMGRAARAVALPGAAKTISDHLLRLGGRA